MQPKRSAKGSLIEDVSATDLPAAVKELSDDELVARLKESVARLNQISAQALADARAGKYVDPGALDLLRGDIDDDELDELEELNAKRLD